MSPVTAERIEERTDECYVGLHPHLVHFWFSMLYFLEMAIA